MERSGKVYKVTLTERAFDGHCVDSEYTVSESQYALLTMSLGQPEAYSVA